MVVRQLPEQQNWSELHSRRAVRAELRRKHRKRNLTAFGIVTLMVLLTIALVTWGAVSGKKVSPGRRSANVKRNARATTTARQQATEPQSSPASAPSSQPVASQSPPAAPAAAAPAPAPPAAPAQVAPVGGSAIYPFTRDGSVGCGHWSSGSTDYPYFGAPRENGRLHGAIDIYPPGGKGTPVKAIKDGTVLQVIPAFYTRADGEVCCGILIDHGDFVAFYGEMMSPALLAVGQTVKAGQQIGAVSGTVQLHFEMYTPGTRARGNWYGSQPSNLEDPTQYMLDLMK